MSLAREIAPHLPLLRRYARALTGAQESGDAFVAAALEAIVARPEEFPRELEPRAGLYKVFHRIWESANVELNGGSEELSLGARKAQERLKALAPLSRQALLLTTLENFTPQETSDILGRSPDEVGALLDDALDALERQTKARILIIEDEAVIAMDLSDLMTSAGHHVCGVESTASGAVRTAERERPDLVLADIQLADGSSGIDAVKDILSSFSVPVIFITAFPDRLLTGERPEPTFLITKPYSPDMVRAAVSQALFFESTGNLN
ncbi:response regulator [Vitreimonas sp.]|jgi:DNA-directed RNA polymerase specialized sigma24 family protein/CheY-like chemotaxis protein|uniref:response regulator n=1 Tax=Vitreimonas sp. TaxID=3069702 RepID=UPI002ED9BCA6